MEAFPRRFLALLFDQASSYQVNEASNQLPLYSPIIRHLGNTDRHRTRKGQKRGKRERRGERERLTDFFATKETGLRTNGRLSLWRA